MNHRTFTGYSAEGLNIAVKEAYLDYGEWLEDGRRYTTVIEGPAATTANVVISEYSEHYWFTITITYREA